MKIDCLNIHQFNHISELTFISVGSPPRRTEGAIDPEHGAKDFNGDKDHHGKSRDEREIHHDNENHDE